MTKQRWQPPPMNPSPVRGDGGSRIKVDEQVVRNMLRVNPALRLGRTTFQVKSALERGEPVGVTAKTVAPSQEAPVIGTGASASGELRDAVSFFLRGKLEQLRAQLAEIEAQRRQLAAREQEARSAAREQVLTFAGLLDVQAVAHQGAAAFGEHAASLAMIGLTPTELLAGTQRKHH